MCNMLAFRVLVGYETKFCALQASDEPETVLFQSFVVSPGHWDSEELEFLKGEYNGQMKYPRLRHLFASRPLFPINIVCANAFRISPSGKHSSAERANLPSVCAESPFQSGLRAHSQATRSVVTAIAQIPHAAYHAAR